MMGEVVDFTIEKESEKKKLQKYVFCSVHRHVSPKTKKRRSNRVCSFQNGTQSSVVGTRHIPKAHHHPQLELLEKKLLQRLRGRRTFYRTAMSQGPVSGGPACNPPNPSQTAEQQPDRRCSFGFALFRGKKASTDEEGTQAKTSESRTQVMRGYDTGFFLPEEAWRSDNIDRINRTTLPTDMTPPFRRYERTLTLRYLEEDVSTVSNEEYLSSQTFIKLRLVLGWLALLAPLPLLMQPAPAFHCLYVVVTTSLLWILRPVPLCVASFFPVVALPLIGVLSTETVCGFYFNESILLCLTSSLMAALAQRQGLQRWLTVACLRCLGGSLRCLLLSLMATTALSAMLLSAPAAAYGVIPLAETLAKEFQRKPQPTSPAVAASGQVNDSEPHPGFGGQSLDDLSEGEARSDRIRKVLLIAVVLSAYNERTC
ncbi:hypothetical protein HPB51_017155 [Rhipicephalus microplus]|uniref:Uncharacterized protein n=1 Tax=Rhipicephalus microplus TaxID=6941 RepID=A0A9J6DVI3_RHIMP|nr:hypothetical protein HPB51_017155 [Rhipicephalus microplus]